MDTLHNIELCPKGQTPSSSPPEGKTPNPLLPSPTLIPPLWVQHFSPPYPLPTGKETSALPRLAFPLITPTSAPPFYISTSPCLKNNSPPLNPYLPPSSITSTFTIIFFIKFVHLPPTLTHLPLHYQTPPTLRLPLPPLRPNSPPVRFYNSTVMVSYTACRNYLPFSTRKTSL